MITRATAYAYIDAIIKSRDLTIGQRLVGIYFARRVNAEGKTWPKIATVAAALGFTPKGVRVALVALDARGWVRIDRDNRNRRLHETNVYELQIPAAHADGPAAAQSDRGNRGSPDPDQGNGGSSDAADQGNPGSPIVGTPVPDRGNEGSVEGPDRSSRSAHARAASTKKPRNEQAREQARSPADAPPSAEQLRVALIEEYVRRFRAGALEGPWSFKPRELQALDGELNGKPGLVSWMVSARVPIETAVDLVAAVEDHAKHGESPKDRRFAADCPLRWLAQDPGARLAAFRARREAKATRSRMKPPVFSPPAVVASAEERAAFMRDLLSTAPSCTVPIQPWPCEEA